MSIYRGRLLPLTLVVLALVLCSCTKKVATQTVRKAPVILGNFTQVACHAPGGTCWSCEFQTGDTCILTVHGLAQLAAYGSDIPILVKQSYSVVWVSDVANGKLKMRRFKHVDCGNPTNIYPQGNSKNDDPFTDHFDGNEKLVKSRYAEQVQAEYGNCYKHVIDGDGTYEKGIDPHVFIGS